MKSEQNPTGLTLHISDSPAPGNSLFLRLILFQAHEEDSFKVQLNGSELAVATRDSEWKDPQILAYALRNSTTATNNWIAREVHMGAASSVSQYMSLLRRRI